LNEYSIPEEPNWFKNNLTLLGVDSNKNMIRDDVEIYIHKHYPGEENYLFRMQALQYAQAYQRSLKLGPTAKNINKHKALTITSGSCSGELRKDYTISSSNNMIFRQHMKSIRDLQFNNIYRSYIDKQIDRSLGAESFTLPTDKDYCLSLCMFILKPGKFSIKRFE